MENTQPRTQPDNFPNPNEGQNVKPNQPDTEINPGEASIDTEVDLDKEKIKIYPKITPPERH